MNTNFLQNIFTSQSCTKCKYRWADAEKEPCSKCHLVKYESDESFFIEGAPVDAFPDAYVQRTILTKTKTNRGKNAIGTLWWTDGEKNLRLKRGEEPPEGFYRGRVMPKRDEVIERYYQAQKKTK